MGMAPIFTAILLSIAENSTRICDMGREPWIMATNINMKGYGRMMSKAGKEYIFILMAATMKEFSKMEWEMDKEPTISTNMNM